MSLPKNHFDLSEIRKKLESSSGRTYWRSLEELADTEDFQHMLHNEFPEHESDWGDGVSRRGFLKIMGASLALAGLNGCTRQPVEMIVPYLRQPEEIVPGKPLFFASAFTMSGVATGLLVESNMGRPTKIEGNPDHPESLGATDKIAQASILGMYDPDRSQAVTFRGNISSWGEFLTAFRGALPPDGAGVRILTQTTTSPTMGDQMQKILQRHPQMKWHQYEPAGRHEVREGAKLAFGEYVETVYHLDRADVILSIDADFVGSGRVRCIRDFARRRNPDTNNGKMNRLYVVESCPSNTGARADHRRRLRPSEIPAFAAQMLAALNGGSADAWITAVARDLQQHQGACLVMAGDCQPPEVHAMVHHMNQILGNTGKTVVYTDPIEVNPVNQLESMKELAIDMHSGKVQTLVILGGNPVYDAPANLDFAGGLSHVGLRVHLSLYDDETSYLCHWHIPEAYYLEAWGDARTYDGTITIMQPLIEPLYGGKSAHEMLAAFTDNPQATSHDVVKTYWKEHSSAEDFDLFWRRSLHNGVVADSALPEKTVALKETSSAQTPASNGMEIQFRPDPTIYDGRYANNAWLQEVPKPLSKVTWDNAVYLSPATAEKLNVANEDVLQLECKGNKIKGPVCIAPGHADDCFTVHLGFGRARVGKVGNGVGFNVYTMRASDAFWAASGVQATRTGEEYKLSITQNHQTMENRELVRSATLADYGKNPAFAQPSEEEKEAESKSLYPQYPYKGYNWGLSIDLNACVGCNACVVACQSENNIAVVGKEQVRRSRELHWIRIDRYFEGSPDDPEFAFQPVPCMHCENAPCETVCPVNATVHNQEGLNEMVYNRCVGTRYCSNNCPYKVRRFNYFLFSDFETPSLKLMRNPEVTVRSRGVMEKCSYCVQRINRAKIEAEKQDRKVQDGEIVTACQQVCPAEAITFGDMNDPNSKVAKLKAQERNYGILTELNTRPHTTYLAHLRNPNPEIKE